MRGAPVETPPGGSVTRAVNDRSGDRYAAAVRRSDIPATERVCWADMEDDWVELPAPTISGSGITIPDMDDSWGKVKDFLIQVCSKWGLHHTKGKVVGPLKGNYFKGDVSFEDASVAGDVSYVSGYLEALKNRWDLKKMSHPDTPAAFRNGFADATPLLLRSSALEKGVASAEQVNCILRPAQRGEENPLLKRLTRLMSVPSNALAVVTAVENIAVRVSKEFSGEVIDAVLDRVSLNRRAISMKMLPSATKKVPTEVISKNGKKSIMLKDTKVVVNPTISVNYRSLATEEEQVSIVEWNNFARLDLLPIHGKGSWQSEFTLCKEVVSKLTTTAAAIRSVLKARKQLAYANLSPENKVAVKEKLGPAIAQLVSDIPAGENAVRDKIAALGCDTSNVAEFVEDVKTSITFAGWKPLPHSLNAESEEDEAEPQE